jgi:hypothetical protein
MILFFKHYLILIFICCSARTILRNKILFTYPQSAMYIYFNTTQQNRCSCVNALHHLQLNNTYIAKVTVSTFETLVSLYKATWHNILQDLHLQGLFRLMKAYF